MITSASEIREWLDMQAAKFEVRRQAWEEVLIELSGQVLRYSLPGAFFVLPNGYRRARRKYGYQRFPSRNQPRREIR